MSSASRKVKNPLLSAAGEGFPFENYTENAFLVPVTPATPAVFSDDAELNNFVGQETANLLHSSATSAIVVDADSEFTPISLHPEEAKDQPTSQPTSQPTKQGYLTTILSSLPNLSLSSITSDTSASQANQTTGNVIGLQDTNPHVPSHDRRDSLRDTSPPVVANFHDPRRTNFAGSAEVNSGNAGSSPAPTIPPALPSSTNGPISYRLGNQRRLKYAPPPDLTSNTSKQYSAPVAQPLVTSHISATPSIFNPNEPAAPLQPSYQPVENPSISTNSPSLQRSTPEYLSQANSLQESFRSSPVAAGVPYSSAGTSRSVTPQNQNSSTETVPVIEKPIAPLSSARTIPLQVPEPITPQNTPANVSYFGFDAGRDFPSKTTNFEKEPVVVTGSHVDTPLPILRDSSTARPVAEAKPSVTFGPVSAVQVSEKLEHLLAERKENTSEKSQPTETKIGESVAQCQTSDDRKSTNAEEKKNLPQSADVFFAKQETSEAIEPTTSPQEVHTEVHERFNLPQSHGVSSNVQPSQQYYQPQPFASSVNFFAEKPPEQTLNFNLTAASTSVASVSSTFAQSASSYFPIPDATSSSSYNLKYKENSTNYPVDVASQQVSFNSSIGCSFPSPSISVAQSSWGGNETFQTVIATCNAPDQTLQQPLFYNIAQFQDDLPKHPPASHLYAPPVKSTPTNHAQHYFDNFAGSKQPYNITSGIGVEFSATSPATTIVPEPTGSATLNPVQMSVNPLGGRTTTDSVPPSFQNLAAGTTDKRMQYREVYHHWFYRKKVEHKVLWLPFSMQDSLRLEEVHNSSEITPETTVATDGGRYDVDILHRQRSPVYWTGESTEVRRCSWFFKGPTESKYVPYDESTAAKLEEEYKQACLLNNWNRRIDLNNGEYIIFHSATVQVHYLTAVSPEMTASWGSSGGSEDSTYLQGAGSRPRVIKRGLDEFHIEDGEPETVDHVLFLVHGIGSVCDLKFRTVEEVVDEFRSISLQLVQSHYRTASEQRIVNRIEVLPISWHTTLHSEDTGIDKKLQAITLDSIPKLRHFTNDTLLDILFYTSPVYCQTIMETVGNELNRLYALFKERNPDFNGGIYLGGHSLGSLILFDLLCHQKPLSDDTTCENNSETNEEQNEEDADPCESSNQTPKRRLSKKISYVVGAAGTGQPYIHYTQLHFHPRAFFAFGSPVGMFVTVRGIDMLGEDFVLPTCPAFFNIFHPFDPVAYRVEALINPEAPKYRPMLIPHHKGRKRMHLELKETMARVGADLKQRLLDSVRNTWNSVYQLAVFHKSDNSTLEREIDKVMEEQLQQTVSDHQTNDDGGAEFKVGKLNGGRRIDYVLQEAPFEYINEYIFALTSHVCYWESEDTMLMILKEIYGSTGVQADAQLPQQTLCVERMTPSPSLSSSSKNDGASSTMRVVGIDPTAPISEKPIGPPPKSGFVKKS